MNKTGYLYSMWSGKLKVHEGHMETSKYNDDRANFFIMRGTTVVKRLMCSTCPGVVMNAVVWLEERDDQKAIDILVQYEIDQIEILKEKIEKHQDKIEMLRKAEVRK